uniref:hypothetical protein n=1 Tax=Stylonema alsidii TaxID=35155 RepID=UPI001FCCC6D2|nr:hypothetical protein MW559_pgp049 [Stylonema alsidii]UNJ15243.1 hypothetical protein [Stylonema alsidii]
MLQNLDIILLTCESLNFSMNYNLVSYKALNDSYDFPYLSSFEIYKMRHANPLRYYYIEQSITLLPVIDLVHFLQLSISKTNCLVSLELILFANKKLNKQDTIVIEKFYTRFNFLFRKYINDKAMGVQYYSNNKCIEHIALANIYILYLLNQKNGYEYFWSYLVEYDLIHSIHKQSVYY